MAKVEGEEEVKAADSLETGGGVWYRKKIELTTITFNYWKY